MIERVSVIGTGRMGTALATALFNKAVPTAVWNRTPSKTEPLARLGIPVARDFREAVMNSSVVIVNVTGYAATWELLRDPGAESALQGKVLIQLSAGLPNEAREMEAWAVQRGIHYLDGAIMSFPDGIGKPDCTILYSGAADVFERVKPVLQAFGDNALHVGSDPGHASTLDVAIVNFFVSALLAFIQGHAVCEEERLPPEIFLTFVKGLMPVIEGSLGGVFARMQKRDYGATQASLEGWSTIPREMVAWSKEQGIDSTIAAAQHAIFDRALQSGRGQDDIACLRELYRKS